MTLGIKYLSVNKFREKSLVDGWEDEVILRIAYSDQKPEMRLNDPKWNFAFISKFKALKGKMSNLQK